MRELLARLTETLEAGRPCVYCALVETRGSTPQKAGAAMLVYPDGSQAGTLGGGCVEAEVKRQALHTLGDNAPALPQLFTFSLDDNYGWDDGLICGGRMTILATPLVAGHGLDFFREFRGFVDSGAGCTEAAVVDAEQAGAPVGSRWLFDGEGACVATLGAGLPHTVHDGLVSLAKRPTARQVHGIAYLPILPRITLLIVGGGHVGQAVAQWAAEVDFEVWLLDDRAAYASAERFPAAQRRLVGDIGLQLQALQAEITPAIYALIVTRGHNHDEEALFHLANTSAGYVGMIGSKRKIKLIFEDLRGRGISSEALDRVHAPLGFAIGAQTVPEIAISIVAELIARRNLGRSVPDYRSTPHPPR